MRDKKDKQINETEAARAFSSFLTKLLLAGLLIAIIWIMYSAFAGNGEFDIFLHSAKFPYSL